MMPSPFTGGMTGLFHDFGLHASSPFAMMDQMMRGAQQQFSAEPMQSFTSTTVMSFNGANGQPKIYQESTSHRRGPGGIEETRQTVRDSERGINKVQIGHRIGERKHVVEREMNAQTGQISENVELENLDEEDAEQFNAEWRQRSADTGVFRYPQSRFHPSNGSHQQLPQSAHAPLAIEQRPTSSRSAHPPSQRSHHHHHHPRHSDTIDLTNETRYRSEMRVNGQLPPPPPLKRKASASSSNDIPTEQRRHRQHRF